MSWHSVSQLTQSIYRISEPLGAVEPRYGIGTVNSYLVLGQARAALIDTGMGVGNLRSLAARYTDLPILVLNSHHHWDHVGANRHFAEIGIHALEAPSLNQEQEMAEVRQAMKLPQAQAALPLGFDVDAYTVPASQATRLLQDEDVVDLGGCQLAALHTPGHSEGHIAFWDQAAGILFSADTAYAGPMYACFPGGDPAAFAASAHRLAGLSGVRLICPGHNQAIHDSTWLRALGDAADAALADRHPHTRHEGFVPGREYAFSDFSIWLPLPES